MYKASNITQRPWPLQQRGHSRRTAAGLGRGREGGASPSAFTGTLSLLGGCGRKQSPSTKTSLLTAGEGRRVFCVNIRSQKARLRQWNNQQTGHRKLRESTSSGQELTFLIWMGSGSWLPWATWGTRIIAEKYRPLILTLSPHWLFWGNSGWE